MTDTKTTLPRANSGRIIEIDFLRGVAIIMMALFHLVFDLMAYFGFDINIQSGPWFWVGRLSAILFMLISGVSSNFGARQMRRGLIVLGAAIVVTLASIPMMKQNYVRFGILHFFGVVMIIKCLYEKAVKNRTARLVTSIVLIPLCFWMGRMVENIMVDTPLLLPLGITYPGFTTFDYYPLFPWAGYFCIGNTLGLLIYPQRRSLLEHLRSAVPDSAKSILTQVTRPFTFMGRHSLLVYLLHQPVILAVLYTLRWIGLL